jgi:hypothetical protein
MMRKGDWIQTFTGVRFYPLDPQPEDINIEDIAHALSMKCRFNGHTSEFYSVAWHSVLVSIECEKQFPKQPNLGLWGLLHDAAEAYLPDIPRPIKNMDIGILRESERLIMKAVVERFNLDPKDEPIEVKRIDTAILADEAVRFMKPPLDDWNLETPPGTLGISDRITSGPPKHSKAMFIPRLEWLLNICMGKSKKGSICNE